MFNRIISIEFNSQQKEMVIHYYNSTYNRCIILYFSRILYNKQIRVFWRFRIFYKLKNRRNIFICISKFCFRENNNITSNSNFKFRIKNIINNQIKCHLQESYQECFLNSKNQITKSEYKNRLHKATSNELNFPTRGELLLLVRFSFYPEECQQLSKHIYKKLQEKKSKWRKILKTLNLISMVLEAGSRRAMQNLKEQLFLVKQLTIYSYNEGSMDRGIQIRKLAKELAEKIENCELKDYPIDIKSSYKYPKPQQNDQRSKSQMTQRQHTQKQQDEFGIKKSFLDYDQQMQNEEKFKLTEKLKEDQKQLKNVDFSKLNDLQFETLRPQQSRDDMNFINFQIISLIIYFYQFNNAQKIQVLNCVIMSQMQLR